MEQGPRAFHAMTNPNCPICFGLGFVCGPGMERRARLPVWCRWPVQWR